MGEEGVYREEAVTTRDLSFEVVRPAEVLDKSYLELPREVRDITDRVVLLL